MKTNSFNILDRHQKINQNYLLEASAGTGKTFSIEHLVVRLLIEEQIKIDEIAIVTFTKAATRDLKLRIRNNLEKALHALYGKDVITSDYLEHVVEQGELSTKLAIRHLEQALFTFDQACIYTIHGFCAKALRDYIFEGDVSLETSGASEGLPREHILHIVRNFFRTGLHPETYHPVQLKILLDSFGGLQKLESKIVSALSPPKEIIKPDDFKQLQSQFMELMPRFKQEIILTKEGLFKAFQESLGKTPKGADKKIPSKDVPLLEQFFHFWQKDLYEADDFLYLMQEGYPYLKVISALSQSLLPIVEAANHPDMLFARLAYDIQELLNRYIHEEERGGFDHLLYTMQRAVKNPFFTRKVQQQFKAAIIDEFQDTDPVQWDIFRSLFIDNNAKTLLYLVGDPKQSIYSFRQADIYTYLDAAQAIGPNCWASLNTNFRSQPALIEGLNSLFSQENAPGLIHLPRINHFLDYQPVLAGVRSTSKVFNDSYGAVHFCSSVCDGDKLEQHEKEHFFPFFVEEIVRLHEQEQIPLNQFAILVSDRFQSNRCAKFLKQWGIPVAIQKNEPLSTSTAIPALYELLNAVLHPKQESTLRTALGGRIMGWTHDKIQTLEDPAIYEQILLNFYALRRILNEEGFGQFFHFFLQTTWLDSDLNIAERILREHEGHVFFQELQQLVELVLSHEHETPLPPNKILEYLDSLQIDEEDESITKRPLIDEDAVQILTIHSSKGLEYGIVFALGLVKPNQSNERLIPIFENGKMIFKAIPDKSHIHCQQYQAELSAEKMRQLYVALTRAKYRVYIPFILSETDGSSAMDLFIAKGFASKGVCKFVAEANIPKSLTCSHLKDKPFSLKQLNTAKQVDLVPPPFVLVTANRTSMFSYSTLSKSGTGVAVMGAPHDFLAEKKSIHTLPTGSSVGTFLHMLFQFYPLQQAYQSSKEIIPWLKTFTGHSPYSAWEEVLADLLFQAHQTKIHVNDAQFSLSQVGSNRCIREMEFLTSCQGLQTLAEIDKTSGILKGVIDLIFQYEGKYYLLDWKSNWLGSSSADYNQERLAQAMQEHHYFLQAAIYKEALQRYLAVVDKRPFEEIFGGTLYVFVRGLHPEYPQNGVYFVEAS